MENSLDYTSGLPSDPDLWKNSSFLFNMTAANKSFILTPINSPLMNKTINIFLVIILFITMVSLGCTMEVSKIKRHVMKPKGLAIAVAAQYGIMPLAAFILVKVFQQTEMKAVTILVCGCCPGGTLSNILALALQGDMNLSLLMTACSTLLAFGMMPLLLAVYCRGIDLQTAMPFVEITISLVMILIPCGIGILINYYRPQYSKTITRVGLTIMLFAILGIIILIAITSGGLILMVLSAPLMASGALMPFIGYSVGYVISFICRLNPPERRTVAVETGCQNTQLCATILKLAFPPELIGPLFLFPIVYAFFQAVEGLLLIVLFKCHQRFSAKGKVNYKPAIAEDHKEACETTV